MFYSLFHTRFMLCEKRFKARHYCTQHSTKSQHLIQMF